MRPSRSIAMPARLSVSVSPRSQVRSPWPEREARRARRLDDREQALLDLLVQRLQRRLARRSISFGRPSCSLLGAAHEHQDAVGGDAVLLRLDRIDVEVVVRDLELARFLGQVGEVVVDLVAHLVGRPGRRRRPRSAGPALRTILRVDLARTRGAEVGEVDLLVALRGDVGERERGDQRAASPKPDSIALADPSQLQLRRARHLGVRQLDEQDRPGRRDPDHRPQRGERPSTASASCARAACRTRDAQQVRLHDVQHHRAASPRRRGASSVRSTLRRSARAFPARTNRITIAPITSSRPPAVAIVARRPEPIIRSPRKMANMPTRPDAPTSARWRAVTAGPSPLRARVISIAAPP